MHINQKLSRTVLGFSLEHTPLHAGLSLFSAVACVAANIIVCKGASVVTLHMPTLFPCTGGGGGGGGGKGCFCVLAQNVTSACCLPLSAGVASPSDAGGAAAPASLLWRMALPPGSSEGRGGDLVAIFNEQARVSRVQVFMCACGEVGWGGVALRHVFALRCIVCAHALLIGGGVLGQCACSCVLC